MNLVPFILVAALIIYIIYWGGDRNDNDDKYTEP